MLPASPAISRTRRIARSRISSGYFFGAGMTPPFRGFGVSINPGAIQPASLLSGLDLPGPDPFALQPGEIHELIRPRRMSPRAAARHAGTTIDAIRAILDEHPAPPQPLTPGQQRTAGRVIAALRARITPADLRDLHNT